MHQAFSAVHIRFEVATEGLSELVVMRVVAEDEVDRIDVLTTGELEDRVDVLSLALVEVEEGSDVLAAADELEGTVDVVTTDEDTRDELDSGRIAVDVELVSAEELIGEVIAAGDVEVLVTTTGEVEVEVKVMLEVVVDMPELLVVTLDIEVAEAVDSVTA